MTTDPGQSSVEQQPGPTEKSLSKVGSKMTIRIRSGHVVKPPPMLNTVKF